MTLCLRATLQQIIRLNHHIDSQQLTHATVLPPRLSMGTKQAAGIIGHKATEKCLRPPPLLQSQVLQGSQPTRLRGQHSASPHPTSTTTTRRIPCVHAHATLILMFLVTFDSRSISSAATDMCPDAHNSMIRQQTAPALHTCYHRRKQLCFGDQRPRLLSTNQKRPMLLPSELS